MKKYKPDKDTIGLMALVSSIVWVLPAVLLSTSLDDFFLMILKELLVFL